VALKAKAIIKAKNKTMTTVEESGEETKYKKGEGIKATSLIFECIANL